MMAVVQDYATLAKTGDVATLCTDYNGTPFGSLAPYALDKDYNPVIFISDLAVHTKNLTKNSASSMMVMKVDKDNVFNSKRITFVGKMVKVEKLEEVSEIFFTKHKQAKDYAELDFTFYRMEISKIYYIGTFGDIRWVDVKDYRNECKR